MIVSAVFFPHSSSFSITTVGVRFDPTVADLPSRSIVGAVGLTTQPFGNGGSAFSVSATAFSLTESQATSMALVGGLVGGLCAVLAVISLAAIGRCKRADSSEYSVVTAEDQQGRTEMTAFANFSTAFVSTSFLNPEATTDGPLPLAEIWADPIHE
jgi:hypothetical protein